MLRVTPEAKRYILWWYVRNYLGSAMSVEILFEQQYDIFRFYMFIYNHNLCCAVSMLSLSKMDADADWRALRKDTVTLSTCFFNPA